jgi:hypothetical protein
LGCKQWQANLRILQVEAIQTVPNVTAPLEPVRFMFNGDDQLW